MSASGGLVGRVRGAAAGRDRDPGRDQHHDEQRPGRGDPPAADLRAPRALSLEAPGVHVPVAHLPSS
jgi:hypothetical protein